MTLIRQIIYTPSCQKYRYIIINRPSLYVTDKSNSDIFQNFHNIYLEYIWIPSTLEQVSTKIFINGLFYGSLITKLHESAVCSFYV